MIGVNKKASANAIYEQQQPINPKPIVATKCASERTRVKFYGLIYTYANMILWIVV